MDTVEYATFCYDTVEVENGLNEVDTRRDIYICLSIISS